jgi:small-conductance mechanosensitive channel
MIETLKNSITGTNSTRMIMAAGIIILTILVRVFFVRLFNRFINKSTQEVQYDPTNYAFLKHAISSVIFIVGFSFAIYTIPSLRALAKSMLAGAGILAVAIGFASQQAFSNIISGVFIIVFKPFRVNDRIQIDQVIGIVEDVTLRHTVIRNFENRRIIIPNSVISQERLVNSDIVDEKICKIMDLGVDYNTNIDLARSIIQEEGMKHANFIDNRTDIQKQNDEHPVPVRVTSWENSAINLRVWIWAKDAPSAFQMGCDLYENIKKRFDKEGIEIPYPHRTIVNK